MSNEELEDDVVLAKFINYMQKALYHMRLNYFRDYERMRDYEVELEEIECPNSKDVINEDISIIGVLNDTEIKLLNLLYTQGLSYKEISEITNENIETLKKRRTRALKKLKKVMNSITFFPLINIVLLKMHLINLHQPYLKIHYKLS